MLVLATFSTRREKQHMMHLRGREGRMGVSILLQPRKQSRGAWNACARALLIVRPADQIDRLWTSSPHTDLHMARRLHAAGAHALDADEVMARPGEAMHGFRVA